MSLRRALCVAVLVLFGTGTAQAIDKEKLRAAARPPGFAWKFGLGWKDGGFHIIGAEPDPETAIAALRKTLTGDGDDAPRYVRLGALYSYAKKKEEANQSLEKAAALYRQRLVEKPDQARVLAEYGDTLWSLEKFDEAESQLRQAVILAPEDW